LIEKWRKDYNQVRPYSSLGNFLPAPGYSSLVVNAKYCYRKSPRTNARSGTNIGD
jgi:transposase InsO family protein